MLDKQNNWKANAAAAVASATPPTSSASATTTRDISGALESLRIVAFGTSKTWGSGLKDPDKQSYVRLLSPTAVNMGLRATPADYPSLCLYSMMGDDAVFDVVILEFSPFRGPQYQDFDRLARRIRARFPSAIIIYLPIYMLLLDVSYQTTNLQEFLISAGVRSPKGATYAPTIRHLTESDMMFPGVMSYSISNYLETVQAIGGYMIEFPKFEKDIKSFIIDNTKYYTNDEDPWDFVHPSALGHQVIAQKIRELLTEIIIAKRPTTIQSGANTAVIGSWLGGKDMCTSWFSGGQVTDKMKNITNMYLVNFTPRRGAGGKWALEVGQHHGGKFSVDCPFPNCNIYISYMIKGPLHDYPRVMVSVNDGDRQQHHKPKLIDPYIHKFHLRQITLIGTTAMPGLVTVSVKPLKEDLKSKLRFRITGVIITPTIIN